MLVGMARKFATVSPKSGKPPEPEATSLKYDCRISHLAGLRAGFHVDSGSQPRSRWPTSSQPSAGIRARSLDSDATPCRSSRGAEQFVDPRGLQPPFVGRHDAG